MSRSSSFNVSVDIWFFFLNAAQPTKYLIRTCFLSTFLNGSIYTVKLYNVFVCIYIEFVPFLHQRHNNPHFKSFVIRVCTEKHAFGLWFTEQGRLLLHAHYNSPGFFFVFFSVLFFCINFPLKLRNTWKIA